MDGEAQCIASMARVCDPRLTWPRFQSLIANLRQRRIIQGATTLYITPRLLHVYLYRDFWRSYGSGFDIVGALKNMPGQMQQWFIAMLRYADDSPVAQAAVDHLLGPRGLIPKGIFPDNQAIGQMMLSLAESSAKPTLRCLQRIIGNVATSELLEIRAARQYLVWALQYLAVWDDCFTGSAELLLKLAEAENSRNGNNATETFVQLFSLIPGMAATQAPASRRNSFLRDALDSNSTSRRRIALATAKEALSTQFGARFIGAEHQGLRKTIEFWRPKTYGELWDAYREVWEMLVGKLHIWQGEERNALIGTIIATARSVLQIRPLSSEVLQTLESLADDASVDVKGLVSFVNIELRFRRNGLDEETINRLASIREKLNGHDFRTKLRRYVRYATTDDAFDDKHQRSSILDEHLEQVAQEGIASLGMLEEELNWLLCEDSSPAFCFAFRLGNHDTARSILPILLRVQESLPENTPLAFLCGYLASIHEQNKGEWESLILTLSEKTFIQKRFADLAISSGMSDRVARKVIECLRSGILNPMSLQRWWFRRTLREMSEPVFLELVDLQLAENRPDLWKNAVHLFYAYFLESGTQKGLPEEATYQVLTSAGMIGEWDGNDVCYFWSRLAAAFLSKYPEHTWEFFQTILRLGTEQWNLLPDLDMPEEHVLTSVFKSDPERGWDCITEAFSEGDGGRSFGIQRWLGGEWRRLNGDDSPGPIQYALTSKVFSWVDENKEDRGRWLTSALPKTLDRTPAGRLTRDFIARYGKIESVRGSLSCRFHTRSWCGSASDYYRELRKQAREWLVEEKNQTVIRWIERYVDELGYDIQQAEIEEERKR